MISFYTAHSKIRFKQMPPYTTKILFNSNDNTKSAQIQKHVRLPFFLEMTFSNEFKIKKRERGDVDSNTLIGFETDVFILKI